MSVTTAYTPRHGPPPRLSLTTILLGILDAAVLAVAVLGVVLALAALARPAAAVPGTPRVTASAPAPARTAPAPVRTAPGPRAPRAEAVRHYTVRAGDSLWSVSLAEYGTGLDWGRIRIANRGTLGSNPGLIYAGQVLVIPPLHPAHN